MRIGIDARLYTQTGVGRYIKNLVAELALSDKENEYFLYIRSEETEEIQIPKNWYKYAVDIPWHSFREQYELPKLLLSHNLDVMHFPYFNVPVFYPGKFLLTIHDLIIDHFDTGRASTLPYPVYKLKRLGYKTALTTAIKRASHITTISEATKDEIMDHYQVRSEKITVTYDALDDTFRHLADTTRVKPMYTFPYILYVGNAYPHKNLENFLHAFKLLRTKSPVKLVFAGNDTFFYPRVREYAHKIGLKNETEFFGMANDSELLRLYAGCTCLVFPSLMEGFGLPTFEALYCNRLPVVSDITVFHELWGDDLPMFNPNDPQHIADVISHTLSLPKSEYARKVAAAKKRINKFNWKHTANQTREIYRRIYEDSISI